MEKFIVELVDDTKPAHPLLSRHGLTQAEAVKVIMQHDFVRESLTKKEVRESLRDMARFSVYHILKTFQVKISIYKY